MSFFLLIKWSSVFRKDQQNSHGNVGVDFVSTYYNISIQIIIRCLENSNKKNEDKEKTDLRAKFGNGGVDLFPRRIRKAWTGEAAFGKSRLDLDIA